MVDSPLPVDIGRSDSWDIPILNNNNADLLILIPRAFVEKIRSKFISERKLLEENGLSRPKRW